MSRHTATGKGLDRPHRESMPPVPGHGNSHETAKSIKTDDAGRNPKVCNGGVATTYFGNSRSAVHPNFNKGNYIHDSLTLSEQSD